MITKEQLENITPDNALKMLQEGNERFLQGQSQDRDILAEVKGTSEGQAPFAIVLGCIDSRTPAETLFDQGIGDIFHTRVAGNVIDGDVLGGMEFACAVVGTPLVLVMGHTSCGAVKGACDGVELGNLTGLLNKIQPSVEEVKGKMDPTEPGFADQVARSNVSHMVKAIPEQSPVLKDLADQGKIAIKGSMYDVKSGKVTFL